jgi:hypothetical protein
MRSALSLSAMSDPNKSDAYTEEDQARRLEAALRGARIVGAPAKNVTPKKPKAQAGIKRPPAAKGAAK